MITLFLWSYGKRTFRGFSRYLMFYTTLGITHSALFKLTCLYKKYYFFKKIVLLSYVSGLKKDKNSVLIKKKRKKKEHVG